ncbi:MAG: TonB-dependent receptor domain-containing protein [Chakrabartia sp.]
MKQFLLVAAGALAMTPGTALAQRTQENLVTQSADAFGKSIGSEKIGLYSTDDIRGFNPIDAGNVRIEGLYFDHIERLPSRVIEGSTIRVGVGAQGYPFPAPTGIVDYNLMLAQGHTASSAMLELAPYGGFAGNAEIKLPILGERLGVAAGVGFREQVRPEGGWNGFRTYGASLVWRPYPGALLTAFTGGYTNHDDEAHATLYPAGDVLPPDVPRGRFLGQYWADRNSLLTTSGVIAKLPFGAWRIEAGLFDFGLHNRTNFADLLRGVAPDGSVASRLVLYDPGSRTDSLSGEGRITRFWERGAMQHRLVLSARGRIKDRLFGGTQRIDLGPSSAILPDFREAPILLPQEKDKDHVQQMTFGLAYGLKWLDHGTLDLSISRAKYTKRLDFVDPSLPLLVTKDQPILITAAGTVNLRTNLSLYGGFVRGLEEALVAPDIASNRSEAPPAIRTRQVDLGLRYAVTPHLTLVAGLFSVKKPYFNLDPDLRYRALGQVDNRGVEVSLAGSLAPGVTLVAGSLFLDPKIAGEAVASGLIGAQPVGSVKRRSIANLDWRFAAGQSPWSADLAIESFSGRIGNAANSLVAPPREVVNLGARYRFKLDGHALLLRAQIQNLFNDYGWQVSSSGGFTYANGRTAMAQLVVDL